MLLRSRDQRLTTPAECKGLPGPAAASRCHDRRVCARSIAHEKGKSCATLLPSGSTWQKNVFSVHGVDNDGRDVLRRTVRRDQLHPLVAQLQAPVARGVTDLLQHVHRLGQHIIGHERRAAPGSAVTMGPRGARASWISPSCGRSARRSPMPANQRDCTAMKQRVGPAFGTPDELMSTSMPGRRSPDGPTSRLHGRPCASRRWSETHPS